jgi:cytochrome P450
MNEMFTRYLDKSFEFRQANDFINQHITGIHRLFYTLDSGKPDGIHNPAFLKRLDAFSHWLRQQPHVAHVSSYVDTMKRLNKAMNGNKPNAYQLPKSTELASQYGLLYELSLPFGQGLTYQVSMNKQKTLVVVSIHESNSKFIMNLNRRAEAWLAHHNPQHLPNVRGTGLDLMFSKMAMNNIPSMVWGTLVSMLLISLLLIIAFKSVKLGLLSMVSNLLPATIAFGFWGWINGRIGIGVAGVVILTLGLVVDDTIHFINRYRANLAAGMNSIQAVQNTLSSTGIALITTSLVFAAGFGVLSLSHFQANADLGLITAVTIMAALLVDIVIIPAWLIFLYQRRHPPGENTPSPTSLNFKRPPSPPAGLFGHLSYLTKGDAGCFYDACRKLQQTYGDIIELKVFGKPWLLVSDRDMIARILLDDREHYPKKGDAVDEMKVILGEQGILVTEGEHWARQRKMSMPAFRQEKLKIMMQDMNEIALRAVDQLQDHLHFSSHEFCNRVGLAIVCKTAFDYEVEALVDPSIKDPVLEAEDVASIELMKRIQRSKYWKKLPLPSNFKLQKLMNNLMIRIQDIAHERDPNADKEASAIFIDMLRKERDNEGKGMSDEELIQMVLQFVAAGHGTSGALFQWVLFYLCCHPDVQEKTREEINRVMENKDQLDFEDYKRLPYLTQVIKETLRLRPPIPIMLRGTDKEVILDNYRIQKNTAIMLMIGVVQNNPAIWGHNCNFFDPEHVSEEAIKSRPKYSFIPFGLGPRMCIGHQFSMLETTVLFAHLLRHYQFELAPGQKIEPFLKLVWGMKKDMRVIATPIKQAISFVQQGVLP